MENSPFVWNNIIIVGPKHSGKTSTGRELAKLLGGTFTDLDELIEVQTGKIPRALFRESPETFQQAEQRALESLFAVHYSTGLAGRESSVGQERNAPGVIAVGGGIIDNDRARHLLCTETRTFLVNLEVSAETAWERVSMSAARSGELPPFLNTATPRETHRLLHERRAAAYREIAGLTVSGEGKTPVETGRELFNTLKSVAAIPQI